MTDQRGSSFGSHAAYYDRARFPPPFHAVHWLLRGDEQVVLDLGAGTGAMTRLLETLGLGEVVALEPDPRMRAYLVESCTGVRALAGSAEDIPLGDDTVDAVVVGNAWHWFDHQRAAAEVARVLRDGGRLGVLGMQADFHQPWVRTFFQDETGTVSANYVDVALPSGSFRNLERAEFTVQETVTRDRVVDFFASLSRHAAGNHGDRTKAHRRIQESLDALFPTGDLIDFPLRAWCWHATRKSRREGGDAGLG